MTDDRATDSDRRQTAHDDDGPAATGDRLTDRATDHQRRSYSTQVATRLRHHATVPLGGGKSKGSAAGLGGAGGDSRELLLLDTLRCPELRPEDQVETSFLRQCLENAMAAELTPYERDVLRLRLGLDGGKGMTVRRVAELSGGSATIAEVRSAERRAFKKLRSPGSVHARDLMAYLDWTADR
ncbi:hypothetical protein ACHAWF_001511 [Thalassiosira exigua]